MERFCSISIIIPAYNEEKYLGPGIAAMQAEIARAQRVRPGLAVEVILVDNASTDRTAALAAAAGYCVVPEKEHNIAKVRNTGAAAATGEVIVTIDADSCIGEGTLEEVLQTLEGGAVGGGCPIRLDDRSWHLRALAALGTFLVERAMGLGAGLYFCRRADFVAVGGFAETLYAAEDLDFAKRLKAHGKKAGQPFKNLRHSVMTTSARKVRLFGFGRMLLLALRTFWRPAAAIRRKDLWDRLFYDVDKLR